MRKTLGFPLAVALVLTTIISAPAAADTSYRCPAGDVDGDLELSSGPKCNISGDISGDVTSDGREVIVGRGGSVDGDVEVQGADLTVSGSVDGDATQVGSGDLMVRGYVGGNAEEHGVGDVSVRRSAEIIGSVGEFGSGVCDVAPAAFVNGFAGGC